MEKKYFLTGEKLVNPYSPPDIKISQRRGCISGLDMVSHDFPPKIR